MSLQVDIWSDVVCPWCYIGKRRFEAALARFEHRDEVTVTWRSFELDPSAPPSQDVAGTHIERIAAKYGRSVADAERMVEGVRAAAASEGLDFRYDRIRSGNSFDAHRLLHLARAHGRQDELKERLDHGTFTDGLPTSDHAALRAVAVEAGLPAEEVDAVLGSDRYADAVRADEAQAESYLISAVPFFVLGRKYGVAGAQSPDVLLAALERAWADQPLVTTAGGGPSCEGDSCAV